MVRKKIKILHIIPRFVTGGAEQLVLQYARRLDRERFEMAVASTVEDGDMRRLFEETGVRIFVGSIRKEGSRLAVASKLTRFIDEYQPDIIHTHLLGGDFFGWYFKVIKKLPIVWISTRHSVEASTSLVRRLIWKRILRRADRIIAVAEKVRAYDIASFGLRSESIQVIKNGIETESLAQIPLPQFTTSIRRLGIVGRLENGKGHVLLFKALSLLKDKTWQFHIFGTGSQEQSLKRLAEKEGISSRITWHGTVKNQAQIYTAVDTLIQPSLREGLSLVIIEAMAAGRLVIASEAAAAELMSNHRTGLVTDLTPEAIAETIRFSFDYPEKATEIAAAARRQAVVQFDIMDHIRELEKTYLDCLRDA